MGVFSRMGLGWRCSSGLGWVRENILGLGSPPLCKEPLAVGNLAWPWGFPLVALVGIQTRPSMGFF